jgi:hypothetical protein
MGRFGRFGQFILILLLLTGLLAVASPVLPVSADDNPPPPPDRHTQLTVNVTQYEWWLVRWGDNSIVCHVTIEHEGKPTNSEIATACSTATLNAWLANSTCSDPAKCVGFYLEQAASRPVQKLVQVALPPPAVWISVIGCDPQPPDNRCSSMPFLHLQGEEPLPNESIIRLNGSINGQPFSCPGDQCDIALQPTGSKGATVEFWADSSFGDSSKKFSALVRVLPWGDFMSPEGGSSDPQRWYVDILSSQWRGEKLPTCADTWQVFPDIGGPPVWLTSPAKPEQLKTQISYYYLAAMLISHGQVNASNCANGGLETDSSANECGLQAAKPLVLEWQNRFDEQIFKVAQDTGVPAQLIKSVFSRESQLWPGIYQNTLETGLGQLTEKGADTVLLWNPSFFQQFCPLVLSNNVCQLGFGNLTASQQDMLRAALVQKADASCKDCTIGIDLTQANFSINLFAQGLMGNCEQVGQMVYNITGKSAGQVSSYVDLWKMTLANYNAGPGCLGKAIKAAYNGGQKVNWENVSTHLDLACQPAVDYVKDITGIGLQPTPTVTAWVQFGTAQPTFTPTLPAGAPTATQEPVTTATLTPTEPPYPGPGAATATPQPYPNP